MRYKEKISWWSPVWLIVLFLAAIMASCAVQSKHHKVKAVPCPCEKQK